MGEIEAHFKFVKLILIYSGIWRFPLKVSRIWQYVYDGYSFLMQFYHALFVLLMIVEFPTVLKIDSTLVINNASLWIICGTNVIKTIICQSKHSLNLLKRILEKKKQYNKSEDPRILKIKKKMKSFLNRLSLYIILTTAICGSMALILVRLAYNEVKKSEVIDSAYKKYPLPYVIWLPFDSDQHYRTAIILLTVADYLGCLYNTVSQIFYWSIITFIISQLQILQAQFEHFDEYADKYKRTLSKLEFLKELIKEHNQIISYVKDLDNVYKYIALFDFTLSSFHFAALLYQLITSGHGNDSIWAMFLLVLSASQLFLLAWVANEVGEQSFRLARAVYLSNWYEQELEVQKLLLLVIKRSQKPVTLHLGPFFDITNNTFVTTAKGAYSYTMLMKS